MIFNDKAVFAAIDSIRIDLEKISTDLTKARTDIAATRTDLSLAQVDWLDRISKNEGRIHDLEVLKADKSDHLKLAASINLLPTRGDLTNLRVQLDEVAASTEANTSAIAGLTIKPTAPVKAPVKAPVTKATKPVAKAAPKAK